MSSSVAANMSRQPILRNSTGILKVVHFKLVIAFAVVALVKARELSGDFINIDCGRQESENDHTVDPYTKLTYVRDSGYIDTGKSWSIKNAPELPQLQYLRSFPDGHRNCYDIGVKTSRQYLIRALFGYGNYDSENNPPMFDLYIGLKTWTTVIISDVETITTKEIIHFTTAANIYVCLVNTGRGTPFISALELRPLKKNAYATHEGSLDLISRFDLGSLRNQIVRYPDDDCDRIWTPYHSDMWETLSTDREVDSREGDSSLPPPPSVVLNTAVIQKYPDMPIALGSTYYTTERIVMYMHFAEIEKLEQSQSRAFTVMFNGKILGNVEPRYLSITTAIYPEYLEVKKQNIFSLVKHTDSPHPPLINAYELYGAVDLSQSLSKQEDVDAIKRIKKMYQIKRNWQGDPCGFVWDGIICSYQNEDIPRIVSLNLSSAGLSGKIAPSIFNLTSLHFLDLSNNNLVGPIPDFLSELPSLKLLNLSDNKLTGSVPESLVQKSNDKMILLSVGGNPNLFVSNSSSSKSKKYLAIPITGSVVAGVIILVAALATFTCMLKRREQKGEGERMALEPKCRNFTYIEVVSITNNFGRVLGKGGFGTVYHGYLDDTQVAVKVLSPSSTQGSVQFRAEVQLLLRVHHKNLTTLVGYCDEGTNKVLLYEYMANGDIEQLLSGSDRNLLTWERRLKLIADVAQGLEYLHNGCKPPIVHRDVKPSNILLNENLEAKLADFGLSRSFPVGGGSHVSTVVAGTPGYLDPELTEMSDVYSFGVVLLYIITRRPAIATVEGPSTHLSQWVERVVNDNRDITNVVDNCLGGDFDLDSAWRAVQLAMACTCQSPDDRPKMREVVNELSECLALEIARKNNPRETTSMGSLSMEITPDTTPLDKEAD